MGMAIANSLWPKCPKNPVENAIRKLMTKIIAVKKADSHSLTSWLRNCPVPKHYKASPIAKANNIARKSINSLMPSGRRSIILCFSMIFCVDTVKPCDQNCSNTRIIVAEQTNRKPISQYLKRVEKDVAFSTAPNR